jgi:translation initiation factor 2 beta subunit (eIF-2beta)/eIF-5
MEQNGKLYLTSDESVLLDTNYRYKISVITIDYLTKKGTKITILTNMETFAKELMFSKKVLITILGKKLSCKSGLNISNNMYYLQGEYTSQQIKTVLYKFIKDYLLCVICDKPEVNIKYKNNKIKQKCKACGNNSYLESCDLDVVHILSTNI